MRGQSGRRHRELAHRCLKDRLDTYGERRDSERPKVSSLSAWLKEKQGGWVTLANPSDLVYWDGIDVAEL